MHDTLYEICKENWYVDKLPVVERVKQMINRRFTFLLLVDSRKVTLDCSFLIDLATQKTVQACWEHDTDRELLKEQGLNPIS